MDSKECLNFNQIYNYIAQKASPKEAAIIEKEVSKCEKCADELKFLRSLHQSNRNNISDGAGKYSDSQPESFFSYEEKFFKDELTEDEQEKFYGVLLNSPEYFDGFKNILRSVQERSKIGKDDRKILKQIASANIKDRLAPYERFFKQPIIPKHNWVEKFKQPLSFFEKSFSRPATLFAVAVFSFLTLFFYFTYQKNVFDKTLQMASDQYNEAVQGLPFTLQELRLTGTEPREFVKFRLTRSDSDTPAIYNSKNIEKALKLNPDDPKLNHKMGVIKYLNGHSSAAEVFFQKAIKSDKNYTPAYNDLSLIRVEQDKPKQALALLQQAIKISPGFLEAQFNLANIYELLKENDKAITAWEEYLKKERNEGVIKAVKFRIQELKK